MKEHVSTACLYEDDRGVAGGASLAPAWSGGETGPGAFSKPEDRPGRGDQRLPVSIREVGRRIGISHSTISLVLKNDPRISAQTRAKVLSALEKMEYRPDPTFHALARSSRARSVARVALVEQEGAGNGCSVSNDCQAGVAAAADGFGYDLERFVIPEGADQSALHRDLSRMGVRSIILSPAIASCDWVGFPWEKYAVVKMGNPVRGPKFHTVGCDEWQSSRTAFEAILNHGYRRVGMVSRLGAAGRFDSQFLNGFLLAQRFVPEECRLKVFDAGTMLGAERDAALARWVSAECPDAVFTDLDSSWIPDALRSFGLPVAYSQADRGGERAGLLPVSEIIGKTAFQLVRTLLHDCCYGEPGISCRELVAGDWMEGASLPLRTIPD